MTALGGWRFAGMHEAYPELVDYVLRAGERVSPRGEPTREVRGAAFVIEDAVGRGVPVGCGRKVGPKMMAIDGSGNLSGTTRPALAILVAPSLSRFAETGVATAGVSRYERHLARQGATRRGTPFFQGAYGPRIGGQLAACEEQLRRDPATRQAVVSLWTEYDRDPAWRDRPCTTELQFMLRDDGLSVFVQMRANDVWTGTCYDVWQFGQVQAAMAHVLGARPGPYHHYATSLHAYERDVERLRRVRRWRATRDGYVPAEENPRETWGPDWAALPPGTYRSMRQVQAAFGQLLGEAEWTWNGAYTPSGWAPDNAVERWYWDRLASPAARGGDGA